MTLFALATAPRPGWACLFLPVAPGPSPYRQRGWLRSGKLASSALASAALAALVSFPLRSGSVDAAATAPTRTLPVHWIAIQKPFQLYALASPEFGKAPALYEARRPAIGEGRSDTLNFGAFDGASAFLSVNVLRSNDTGTDPGFFVDLARRAAEAGLSVNHTSQPSEIAGRFGAIEHAGAVLGRGGIQAHCQLFRLHETGPGLHVAGLACLAGGRELEPGSLACLVDRLSLVSAGDDAPLRLFFVTAELKRDRFCAGSKYLATEKPAVLAEPAQAATAEPPPAAFPKPQARKKRRDS